MKALKIIFGILSVIVAAVFMVFPIFGQVTYLYVASIYFGIVGIVYIIDYCIYRKERRMAGLQAATGGVGIVLSILAVVFMIFNITIPGFTYATEYLVALLLIISLLVEGILTIISACTYPEFSSGIRAVAIVFGVLMIIASCVAFGFVPFIIGMFGIFTAIGLAVSGVSLIVSACSEA